MEHSPNRRAFSPPGSAALWAGQPRLQGEGGKSRRGAEMTRPPDGVELRCFLVVSNYARSLAFYRDVLGARVLRELPGTLCELRFAGSQILLSAPFGSRPDNPAATDPPPDRKSVISELSIQVPDCSSARRGSCALAEPSFSPRLSIGATRLGPSSMTQMDIS